ARARTAAARPSAPSAGTPMVTSSRPARTTAASSASIASAARSTAALIAASSSADAETSAKNSTSCRVDHAPPDIPASADGQDDQRLVVEAGDAPRPRDLAVRVEAGHRGARRTTRDGFDLPRNALVAEDATARDAVEGEQAG